MTIETFRQLSESPIILDGATGTWLQSKNLPSGTCPEKWVLDNPQILAELQAAYCESGSRILYAFTFGANRLKLMHHGLAEHEVPDYNMKLATISCQVRDQWNESHPDKQVYVAGDLAPTGAFLAPAGTLTFDQLTKIYQEQAASLIDAGVDLFVIETMYDLAQARAAVIAIRDLCNLPIMVSMTLEAHGKTMSGNSLTDCLLTLASLDIQAFGLNCSHGPEKLGEWLQPLLSISPVPLLAKPNAGLPRQEGDRTIFPMQPDSFAHHMARLADLGITLTGGCCGTTPDHITALSQMIAKKQTRQSGRPAQLPAMISSGRRYLSVDQDLLKDMDRIKIDDPDSLIDELLDIDDNEMSACLLELPDLSELAADDLLNWTRALEEAQSMIAMPMVFVCESEKQVSGLKQVLRYYHGRAGILSENPICVPGALLLN